MNLLDIRKHFRTLSGRYDLVDDDVSGTVNFLINEGCRYLDRITEHQKTWGSHFVSLAANAFSVSIPYCRAIKEVWISSTTERWQLEKMNLQDLIAGYLSSAPDSGAPLYYSPVITRKIPEDADLTAFASYMTYLDTRVHLDHDHNGIVILPPADMTLLIEVRGFFYSKELIYLALAPTRPTPPSPPGRTRAGLVKEKGPLQVPLKLRNAPTRLMEGMGYGAGYRYPHEYEGHYVPEEYLPDEIRGERIVKLSASGLEKTLAERLAALRAAKKG